MRVLLASSWMARCGIADYAEQWERAVRTADPRITVTPSAEALDPEWAWAERADYDVLVLNHHAALHSRWQPEHVQQWKDAGAGTLVIYHDTYAGTPDQPNHPKAKALCEVADVFVAHEPVADLPKAVYLRQGVADWAPRWQYDRSTQGWAGRPVLGTVGFNQGWREFDRLAAITADAGWALVILSTNATAEDEHRWRAANPWLYVRREEWLPTEQLVSLLGGCDATCFVHQCGNSGTSGTLRLGLAARKPVLALKSRQYRDLYEDEMGQGLIRWVPTLDHLHHYLAGVRVGPVAPGIVWLAERDSWARQGRKYAQLLRGSREGLEVRR